VIYPKVRGVAKYAGDCRSKLLTFWNFFSDRNSLTYDQVIDFVVLYVCIWLLVFGLFIAAALYKVWV